MTKADILKIRKLNLALKQQEQRIKLFAERLNKQLIKQKKIYAIDDFNYTPQFCVFAKNKLGKETSNPIYTDKTYLLFKPQIDESFYADNWNDLHNGLLKDERFCYTMHCLLFHSKLSVERILRITEICIELKVDYQFLLK